MEVQGGEAISYERGTPVGLLLGPRMRHFLLSEGPDAILQNPRHDHVKRGV